MRSDLLKIGVAGVLGVALTGCGGQQRTDLKADGSSTVFPITEAVAEEFGRKNQNLNITVGISGTGGGFKKFLAGDTILQNASRPIKESEDKTAKEKGIEYIELPVAYDALTVVVNPKNTWATNLTVAELKKIWAPGSKVKNWSQVRAGFPNKPLKLYGAGTDSGTFDYFTEAVNGKEGASRSDYVASEDDNVLVQGVQRDEGALGYFGLAYYEENAGKLKAVSIDGVQPTLENANTGKYKPLSRPLFVYVEKNAAGRPEVKEFIKFYLSEGRELVKSVGYVPLPDDLYAAALKRFEDGVTGTMYGAKDAKKKPLAELMAAGK